MYRTGIGMDRSRSLSLARYSPAKVLNTLPKAPSRMASRAMTVKYIHASPASVRGAHRKTDRSVNIVPRTPIIRTPNITNRKIVDALERGLLFRVS